VIVFIVYYADLLDACIFNYLGTYMVIISYNILFNILQYIIILCTYNRKHFMDSEYFKENLYITLQTSKERIRVKRFHKIKISRVL